MPIPPPPIEDEDHPIGQEDLGSFEFSADPTLDLDEDWLQQEYGERQERARFEAEELTAAIRSRYGELYPLLHLSWFIVSLSMIVLDGFKAWGFDLDNALLLLAYSSVSTSITVGTAIIMWNVFWPKAQRR